MAGLRVGFDPVAEFPCIGVTFIGYSLITMGLVKIVVFVARVDMQMVMPDVLIAIWFIMLSGRDSTALVRVFHSQCDNSSCVMDFCSTRWFKVVNALYMKVRHHQDMSFIIGPPFACDEAGHVFILIDDVALFCALVWSFYAGHDPAKWALVTLRSMRIQSHLYLFPSLVQ